MEDQKKTNIGAITPQKKLDVFGILVDYDPDIKYLIADAAGNISPFDPVDIVRRNFVQQGDPFALYSVMLSYIVSIENAPKDVQAQCKPAFDLCRSIAEAAYKKADELEKSHLEEELGKKR